MRGENNVITLRGPKHAQFANEDTRLLTFRDWPQAMPQRPKDLAEAGFFYTQIGDACRCFSCGLLLRDWRSFDIVAQEHFKFRSNCYYLNMCFVKPDTMGLDENDTAF